MVIVSVNGSLKGRDLRNSDFLVRCSALLEAFVCRFLSRLLRSLLRCAVGSGFGSGLSSFVTYSTNCQNDFR